MSDISDRLLTELVDAVKDILRKEQSDRLRDIYLIGDIDKDSARASIERLRELANDSRRPITLYINSAGGNVTDALALHDATRLLARRAGTQLRQIIPETKRADCYLDAVKATSYGLIVAVLGEPALPVPDREELEPPANSS